MATTRAAANKIAAYALFSTGLTVKRMKKAQRNRTMRRRKWYTRNGIKNGRAFTEAPYTKRKQLGCASRVFKLSFQMIHRLNIKIN
jgi:hypothetical protein